MNSRIPRRKGGNLGRLMFTTQLKWICQHQEKGSPDREVKIMLGIQLHRIGIVLRNKKWVKQKRGNVRSANVTNESEPAEESERYQEQERNEEDPEYWGDYLGVNFAESGNESLCDLDLEGIENYGADSDVDQFLQNNEGNQGY